MVLLSHSGFFQDLIPQSHLSLFLLKFGMDYDRSLIPCIHEGRILCVCYTVILFLSLNIKKDLKLNHVRLEWATTTRAQDLRSNIAT
jgi:hypothetical protein